MKRITRIYIGPAAGEDGASYKRKEWDPGNRDQERKSVLQALAEANTRFEMSRLETDIEIEVLDTDTDKTYGAAVPVDRLSEIDDVFNRSTIPEEFHEILDGIRADTRQEERPRTECMSWVHMGIREDKKLMGWVTACVDRQGSRDNIVRVSFAFCRKDDCFSRRIGRILSRQRMDDGQYVVLMAGPDRYSTVRTFVLQHASGRRPTNMLDRDADIGKWPHWLDPSRKRRNDIPEDVMRVLEDILDSKRVDILIRNKAEVAINRDRTPHYDTWPIRE